MFFSRGAGIKYVSSGDSDSFLFEKEDFNLDGNWNDLDLSAIVPVGAKVVHFNLIIGHLSAAQIIIFRKKGHTFIHNEVITYTQVNSKIISHSFFVGCDTDRVVQYKALDPTWIVVDLYVHGWIG